jgi:putative peptidoglycan lipid II flippase
MTGSPPPSSSSPPSSPYEPSPRKAAKSFTANAVLIGVLTFASRILGLARESIAAGAYGDNPIWAAFVFAFTIPNLFRKLFGEGALSAAFIPLYAQAVRQEKAGASSPDTQLSSHDFALASVNLLCFILLSLTAVGELCLLAAYFLTDRPDYILAIKLTAIMLPYVLLICGSAFLGAILQVHQRFAAVTATSIVLNAVLIAAIALGSRLFDFNTEAGQTRGTYLLSVAVLVSGVAQVAMLVPSLRAVGFRFRPIFHVLTPQVRKMLWLTLPVALSAGVLQVGVMLDKAISFALAKYPGHELLNLGFVTLPMPMAEGAAVRLNWAQYLYQFPLGVFAIALATAIFPTLAEGALDRDKSAFRAVLRRGITASLFIGLPASVGMVVVADSAVRLMFQHGKFGPESAALTILSTRFYSAAIWAFSLQQILNRAYYALHDTRTPLIWGIVNLVINLVVELPLLWTPLGEAGMAVGTLVSFAIQSLVMTWALSRRLGGLGLSAELRPVTVMTLASLFMGLACYAVTTLPGLPTAPNKLTWATLLGLQMITGIVVYAGLCQLGGVNVLSFLRRRKAM